MKLPPRTLLLLAGATLLPVMIFAGHIVAPLRTTWLKQTQALAQKQQFIAQAQRTISSAADREQELTRLGTIMQPQLVPGRSENAFLNAVDAIAASTNVHIESLNPLPLRELGTFNELSVEINMEANLGNLVRFLYFMRKSSVVLVVNRLRLQPKAAGSALLNGHLVISTIFFRE